MIWLWAAALAIITAFLIALPLLRRRQQAVERRASAMAIFEDQLAEVDRDEARGIISGDEAEAAKAEIKRRMLQAAKGAENEVGEGGGSWVLGGAALLTPVLAFVVYGFVGQPQTPSLPFAERAQERSEARELAELTADLQDRLLNDPTGGQTEGWVILGQTYMRLGLYQDAAASFATVVERPDAGSAIASQLAEAIIAVENGTVTPAAEAMIERALMLDPLNPAGSFYQSVALEQRGDVGAARGVLVARLQEAQGPQPWMESFLGRINALGERLELAPVGLGDLIEVPRGPSAADVEAARSMSREEQTAFIESMVDGLAARLAEEPGNLDGWIQLGRSYLVLGRQDEARQAFVAAVPLLEGLPPQDPRRAIVARGVE